MRKEMFYKHIENTIRERILNGAYPTGSQIPTDLELAKEFGVNRLTVAKGLSALSEAGLLERTRGRGSFVKNIPQEINRPFLSGAIKYVTPGSVLDSSPVSHGILLGIHDVVRAASQCAVGVEFYSTTEEELEILRRFRQPDNAGYVIWPAYDPRISAELLNLERHNFPFVQIDSFAPGSESDYVGSDNFSGSRMMLRHLIDYGHRRIVYVTVPPDRNALGERLAGVISGFTDAHLPFTAENLLTIPVIKPVSANVPDREVNAFLYHWLLETFQQAPEKRPTALFACNDSLALALLSMLQELGIRVPEDLSLAGYDDIDQAAWCSTPLTTVAQDFFALGQQAARILLERRSPGKNNSDTSRQYRLQPKLIVRQSTRAIYS